MQPRDSTKTKRFCVTPSPGMASVLLPVGCANPLKGPGAQHFAAVGGRAGSSQATNAFEASPPSQIWKGDQDALRFLTRQNGQVTSLWKELYEGDGMTWEVMMKFREKPKSNTALMHTYGKKFNDNTYSSSHRRRAVGIFVGPSGQHHIFGCAGSNVHTGDKGPDLPRSCNFFCIAANSIDAAMKRSWSGFAD